MYQHAAVLFRLSLSVGQMRGPDHHCHNVGWYNKEGKKLGWGDLEPNDFPRIQKLLEEGEEFWILPESESFWNFVEKVGYIGADCDVSSKESNPGKEYVHKNASWLITKEGIWRFVKAYGVDESEEATWPWPPHFKYVRTTERRR